MPSEYAILERANEAGYLPRPQPQRAFADDYRKPVEGVVGSRLGVDIDGRPIADTAVVAGRRRVSGDDEALTRTELDGAVGGITGGASLVPRGSLPSNAVGAYNETRNTIRVADDLPPDQQFIATAHEFGHAIDKWRGTSDVKWHEKALRKIFTTGARDSSTNREKRADLIADEIVTIADTDPAPNKARVRIDARKWWAAKVNPKKYGERITAAVSTTSYVVSDKPMSPDEWEATYCLAADGRPVESTR